MWDESMLYDTVREIRTKTTTYLGVGAIDKIDDIFGEFKEEGISVVLCVTGGHSYKLTGAWDKVEAAAARHGLRLALYTKVTPNPTTDSVDEAAALGREAGAGAVLCIGGPVIAREMFAVFTSIAVAAAVSVPERAKATK